MLGSDILEVAIGIVFIYILIAIICTAVREGIEAWFKTRAAFLEYGIRELLHDKGAQGIASALYNHPLIHGLFSDGYTPGRAKRPRLLANGKALPSYIPSKNFALALMDIAARGPVGDNTAGGATAPIISLDSIRSNISNIGNPAVQRVLLTAIDTAQGDINKAQANIQAWFDSSMDRVSGWYKRSTQWVLFWIGLAVAVGLNVNSITIAEYLYRNDAARETLVARAESSAADTAFLSRTYEEVREDLDSLRLPIGWDSSPHSDASAGGGDSLRVHASWDWWTTSIVGWLMTAFAATLGAPFWFDVLNRIMVIRSTVKPHEKSPEEASEDRRQPPPQQAAAAPPPPVPLVPAQPGAPLRPPGGETTEPDIEIDTDGCDVTDEEDTKDEDLPPAEGGVA